MGTGGDLSVLFQDESLLVVDKPAGMHTAPLRPGETGTLLELVIARFPEVADLPGRKAVEPGLLHRLDRETSGIVVIARTAAAFQGLRGQFESGLARKEYVAVCGVTHEMRGGGRPMRMESRFAPYGTGRRMVRVVLPGEQNRRILAGATHDTYATEAVVERHEPGHALVRASLAKGFRHQVRAHLSFLGYPILGDPLYGAPILEDFPIRMYLHASAISLSHPLSGEPLVVRAPIPEEFSAIFPPRDA